MARQTTASKGSTESKTGPRNNGHPECSNGTKLHVNESCWVSDHPHRALFHKSRYVKEQILHKGKKQQALTWCGQLKTLHRKMCLTENSIKETLKHLSV